MDDLAILVAEIERKAQELAARLTRLGLENRQLKSKLHEAEVSLDLYKEKVKELENKNSILKVSGSINRNNEKHETQKAVAVIDGLVKEIDRCLTLLGH